MTYPPSKAEEMLAREMLRLDMQFIRQYQIPTADGYKPYKVDFAFLESKVLVEVDGPYHFTPEQTKKDHARQNHLARKGWVVIRLNADDVYQNPRTKALYIQHIIHERLEDKQPPAAASAEPKRAKRSKFKTNLRKVGSTAAAATKATAKAAGYAVLGTIAVVVVVIILMLVLLIAIFS